MVPKHIDWILMAPQYHFLMLAIVLLFIWRVEKRLNRIERKLKEGNRAKED